MENARDPLEDLKDAWVRLMSGRGLPNDPFLVKIMLRRVVSSLSAPGVPECAVRENEGRRRFASELLAMIEGVHDGAGWQQRADAGATGGGSDAFAAERVSADADASFVRERRRFAAEQQRSANAAGGARRRGPTTDAGTEN